MTTRLSFWEQLWNFRWDFALGTWKTIQISVLSMMLAFAIGLVLALTRVYGHRLMARMALAYIEVVRGTPLLVQLYLIYFGLPNIPVVGEYLRFNALTAAVLGVGLNYAAYEAEIHRAGIMSVSRGQLEAGLALGLSRKQAVRLVVLPQAFRNALPPITNDFVALFKDTSIVSVVAMAELTKTFTMVGQSTQRYLGFALVTAAIYFVISYPISRWARRIEERLHPHYDFGPQPH